MKATFIIPCYNEEQNISELFNEVIQIINRNKYINFIFVNNGSVDNSEKLLNKFILESQFHERISLTTVNNNIGYGNGILEGLKNVNTELVGWIHADLQIDFKNLEEALKIYNEKKLEFPNQFLYIRGKRINRDNYIDKLYTNLMAIYTSFLKRGFYSDITGLPVLFETDQYQNWKNPPIGFALDVYSYIFAKRANAKILRFPVKLNLRKHGKSSWNTGLLSKIKMSKYYLKEIKKI